MRYIVFLLSFFCVDKVSAQVSLSWMHLLGNSGSSAAIDHRAANDGDFYLLGNTRDTLCGYEAFYFVRIDVSGTLLQERIIETDTSCQEEAPRALDILENKNIIACGSITTIPSNALLLGLDSNLSQNWRHDTEFYAVDCKRGLQNDFYFTGNYPPTLQRRSTNGNFSWEYSWAGTMDANARKVLISRSGNAYALLQTFDTTQGVMQTGFGLMCCDSLNTSSWSMTHNPLPGQLNLTQYFALDTAGNAYVSTMSQSATDSVYLSKVSTSGQHLWTTSYERNGFYSFCGILYDPAHNEILTLLRSSSAIKIYRFTSSGALRDSIIETYPSSGYAKFVCDTLGDVYCMYTISGPPYTIHFSKYNYGGGLLWDYTYATQDPTLPVSISVEPDGSVYSTLTLNHSGFTPDSILVFRFDQPLSAPFDSPSANNLLLYPNPNDGVMTLRTKIALDAKLTFYNLLGQVIHEEQLSEGTVEKAISIPGLAEGVYSYRIATSAAELARGKLVIAR